MRGRLFLILIAIALPALAQKGDKDIATGNQYYRTAQYDLAEKFYRKALKDNPASTTAAYNLSNALYRQKRYKESLGILGQVKVDGNNKALQAAVHYNTGVAHTKEKDLEASIEAYKAALRLTPDDKEARENLQLALRELKREKQQSQQQKQQRSSMSQSEAERKLQQLQQKEKQIQQRLQRNSPMQGSGMEKDW
jgi:tetratricopeptide (TPR) repeat protein